MQKDNTIGGQPVAWQDRTELVRMANFWGWSITRHWAKTTLDKSKEFLYVATKEGHKRITTNDWKEVDKTIYNKELKTLL